MTTLPMGTVNCRCVLVPIVPVWNWRHYRKLGVAYGRLIEPVSGRILRRARVVLDREVTR